MFNGAALVFYSYIGFDSVACSAEEVRRPSRDLPLGILGALGTVTICYMLMSAALVSAETSVCLPRHPALSADSI